ncbi:hypothetical protein KF728_19500 [Candidatus Obscuribacterales bacterium]|nr:hypothetical protein [Candidatus Obscuribacterales bacterium]MBX3152353.1 hypothetical protein [Candidatus Obscuribacterales bacterium]
MRRIRAQTALYDLDAFDKLKTVRSVGVLISTQRLSLNLFTSNQVCKAYLKLVSAMQSRFRYVKERFMTAEKFEHDTAGDISVNDDVSRRLFSESYAAVESTSSDIAQSSSIEKTGITAGMLKDASGGKLSEDAKKLLEEHFAGSDVHNDITKFNTELSRVGSEYRMMSESVTRGTVNKRILAEDTAVALVKAGESPKALLMDLLQSGTQSQYRDRGLVVQRELHIPKPSRLGRPVTDLHEFLKTFDD